MPSVPFKCSRRPAGERVEVHLEAGQPPASSEDLEQFVRITQSVSHTCDEGGEKEAATECGNAFLGAERCVSAWLVRGSVQVRRRENRKCRSVTNELLRGEEGKNNQQIDLCLILGNATTKEPKKGGKKL